jgi:AcrR family transcriptional regulator
MVILPMEALEAAAGEVREIIPRTTTQAVAGVLAMVALLRVMPGVLSPLFLSSSSLRPLRLGDLLATCSQYLCSDVCMNLRLLCLFLSAYTQITPYTIVNLNFILSHEP